MLRLQPEYRINARARRLVGDARSDALATSSEPVAADQTAEAADQHGSRSRRLCIVVAFLVDVGDDPSSV
jgi:hypothetical protein